MEFRSWIVHLNDGSLDWQDESVDWRGKEQLSGARFNSSNCTAFHLNEVAGLVFPIIGNIAWDIVVFLIVLAAIRQASAEERLWGYDKGLAPIGQ